MGKKDGRKTDRGERKVREMENWRNDGYPSDFEAKQMILEIGRRMYAKNFVASNDGNISCKVSAHRRVQRIYDR